MPRPCLHLIGNSHLDPVWLWDWREGLTEGISTCQSILGLMEEFPEMTYIRGESAIYEHVERHAPEVFRRIVRQIEAGRWEVVGGSYLQPDTNLPRTEVLCRHFTTGLRYMEEKLGRRPRVAWAADAFGHSAGLPEILSAAGLDYFAFSRPSARDLSLPAPAFWWEAASGRRILCWRLPVAWYGNERGDMFARLDESLAHARTHGLSDIAVFYGLGNHGGGPCRRHLHDIRRWAERTPEARVEHSGLARFFEALTQGDWPVFRGELNFTLRGCYSSATRFKAAYRRAESLVLAAERAAALAAPLARKPLPSLAPAWESVLFNTFHDILPGTSIERAMEQQSDWLGAAAHRAREVELHALHAIGGAIDTRPPAPEADMPAAVPVLLWNPHAREFAGQVEFETCVDHRPVFRYENRPDALPLQLLSEGAAIPFQRVETEHRFMPSLPWRKRVVADVTIPPLGWRLLHFSWTENPRIAPPPRDGKAARATDGLSIENGFYRVEADANGAAIHVTHRGRKIFGAAGLTAACHGDPWGSWGGHEGEPEANDISGDRRAWKISRIHIVDTGPLRASLWVEFADAGSRLALTLRLESGRERVHAEGRLFWAEPGRRLKLSLPGPARAVFEVPGGACERGACGEVPGGRWVRAGDSPEGWLLASDSFYNYDLKDDALRVTVLRANRYAWNPSSTPDEQPWRPYQDLGEHRFSFALAPRDEDADRLADELETPPVAWVSPAHEGRAAPTGSLGALSARWRLLALKPANRGGGLVLRVQNASASACDAVFSLRGREIALPVLAPGEIAGWLLPESPRLAPERVDLAENPWRESAPETLADTARLEPLAAV